MTIHKLALVLAYFGYVALRCALYVNDKDKIGESWSERAIKLLKQCTMVKSHDSFKMY